MQRYGEKCQQEDLVVLGFTTTYMVEHLYVTETISF